ncbi:MAG: hypothetical protein ABJQ29_10925 [Luteolibacter sp.]
MKILFCLFAVSPLISETALCQQKLIPYEKVFVSVNTERLIDRKNKRGAKLNVSVRMHKGPDAGDDPVSIGVDCYEFSSAQRMMPEADLDAFYEMGKAAIAGKEARKEVVTETFRDEITTVYEVAGTGKDKVIRVSRGDESADFPPEEAERVRAAIAEAVIGKAWFEKILIATELPEVTPDARPPRSQGYYLNSEIGQVSGRGISYEVTVSANSMLGDQSYRLSHGLIVYENGQMTGTMSGDWIKSLLHKVTLALDAAKNGKNYSFKSGEDDGRVYQVTANPATQEADLTLQLGNFFKNREPKEAHFGVAQLDEIRRLIDEYEVRQKWFEANEGLFFTPLGEGE